MTLDIGESWKAIVAVGTVVGSVIGVASNAKGIWDWVAPWIGQRSRLRASAVTTSDPYEGNTVTITNLSAKPMLIDHWVLVWVRQSRFHKVEDVDIEEEAEYDWGGQTIPAHDRIRWHFSESQHFVVGTERRKGLVLMLRLVPADGGRPYNLRIWPWA